MLNAQKQGAAGILIYSDPADDGYAKGDVYPDGPYRPGSAIQRGSVQFLSLGPGDPSTPGGPSVKNATGLPIDPCERLSAGPSQRSWTGTEDLHPGTSGRRRRGSSVTTTSPRSRRCRSATIPRSEILKFWPAPRFPPAGKEACRWPITSGPVRRRSDFRFAWTTRFARSGT